MKGRLFGKAMVLGTAVVVIGVSLLSACQDGEEDPAEPSPADSTVTADGPDAGGTQSITEPDVAPVDADETIVELTGTAVISTILISGQPADIDAIVQEVSGTDGLQLNPLGAIPSLADPERGEGGQFFVDLAADRPELAMLMPETRRYEVRGLDGSDGTGPRVHEVRRRIYELVEATLRDPQEDDSPAPLVFADVDTLALVDAVVNVDPASNGIVPTGVYPTPVPGGQVDPNKLYGDSSVLPGALLGQWALQAGTGINLSDDTGARNAAVAGVLGEGSVVAMFDTLPAALANGVSAILTQSSVDLPRWDATTGTASLAPTIIERVNPHGSGGYPALPTSTSTDPSRREHGLFTASLIHAVAPSATLRLVTTANDSGQSTVFNLVGALHWYLANEGAVDGNDASGLLNDTVLHLGIGVRFPSDAQSVAEANAVTTTLASLIATVQALIADPSTDAAQKARLTAYVNTLTATNTTTNSLPALYAPIQLSRELGAFIVASAGNKASGLVANVVDQLPAAYANTLAVVGTTKDTSFACVSGSLTQPAVSKVLAAPAGFEPSSAATCSPSGKAQDVERDKAVGCSDCLPLYILGAVSTGVMTTVHDTPSDHIHNPVAQDRYGYWAGTSWSAAFVSGAAALVRDQCSSYDPGQVEDALLDYAGPGPNGSGTGVLDVSASVSNTSSCP